MRRLADDVQANEARLDVLINNAGIGRGPIGAQHREESVDGHELRFAVNYLAPYLLTRLLLPLVEASAPARVVNVRVHRPVARRLRRCDAANRL